MTKTLTEVLADFPDEPVSMEDLFNTAIEEVNQPHTKHFQCQIHNGLVKWPAEKCSKCDAIFCKHCIESTKDDNCQCGEAFIGKDLDQEEQEKLLQTRFKCGRCSDGTIFTYKEAASHATSCGAIPCPAECGQQISSRNGLRSHLVDQCHNVLRKCVCCHPTLTLQDESFPCMKKRD